MHLFAFRPPHPIFFRSTFILLANSGNFFLHRSLHLRPSNNLKSPLALTIRPNPPCNFWKSVFPQKKHRVFPLYFQGRVRIAFVSLFNDGLELLFLKRKDCSWCYLFFQKLLSQAIFFFLPKVFPCGFNRSMRIQEDHRPGVRWLCKEKNRTKLSVKTLPLSTVCFYQNSLLQKKCEKKKFTFIELSWIEEGKKN